jgi:lipopolysaccharide/colanic/teichoic acid biosynthesis glycosyltransferase
MVQSPFSMEPNNKVKRIHWQMLAMILIIIVLFALLLVNIHGELGGAQTRFGID